VTIVSSDPIGLARWAIVSEKRGKNDLACGRTICYNGLLRVWVLCGKLDKIMEILVGLVLTGWIAGSMILSVVWLLSLE